MLPATTPDSLRWVSDDDPGIRRLRRGRGFSYVDADGAAVKDEQRLQRIRKLAVPPAWTDVWICPHRNGHLQATGRDARGRKQYRYHDDWRTWRDATKYGRLREFGAVLPRLRRRVRQHLKGRSTPTRERVIAALVQLLDSTGLRIGNEEYLDANHSYGLSTLRKRHAKASGASVRLSFIGKGGIRHDARLDDRRVARIIQRCQDLPGQPLFQYLDGDGERHAITSTDVNDWLAEASGAHVTAKDFRTWHGTVLALDATIAACRATQRAEPAPAPTVTAIVTDVARHLGNTPVVCRRAYIHPGIIDLIASLTDTPGCARMLARKWMDAPPSPRALHAGERRLMAWLKSPRSAVR